MLPEILLDIPFSTIFILLLAAAVTLMTSLANRFLTDPEKTKSSRKEVAQWNSELRKAQRSGDKKRVEKLMKQQQYILQLQSKMMWQSMKVNRLSSRNWTNHSATITWESFISILVVYAVLFPFQHHILSSLWTGRFW